MFRLIMPRLIAVEVDTLEGGLLQRLGGVRVFLSPLDRGLAVAAIVHLYESMSI